MTPVRFENPPRRVLIVKPSAIGDVVHTLPILELLRRRWPGAHIAWLVTPVCAGLVEGHPLLNEVIRFDRRLFARFWRPGVMRALWQFLRGLRRRRFDLVIDFQGLLRSGVMTWATRAPHRVGFANARELAWLFYNHRVPVGTMEQHAIDRYLKLAAAVGCETQPLRFVFPVTDADRSRVAELLGGVPEYAVLLPGTNWATKRWPVEHFASLVRPLRERFGLASVVAGGPGDAELGQAIPGAMNLAGRTTLRELVALLEGASLVVANDSGPMHIAAALGRPLVTPFGPTNPIRTGPYGRMDSVVRMELPCSPCYSRRCRNPVQLQCLRELDPQRVLEMAEREMRLAGRRSEAPARL
jgi:heptosyltransferase I